MVDTYDNYERERVSLPIFKFDKPGDTLIGKLVERDTTTITDRGFGKYTFADTQGEMYRVFGSFALDDALDRFNVGEIAEIIYEGEEVGSSGYPYKRYTVNRLKTS